ncbi:MAG TPA: TonB-dependent receptor [Vicinamibacterales bacterium]|nr:TonB-dependent receptor [Vicinamibacterales bacterium]
MSVPVRALVLAAAAWLCASPAAAQTAISGRIVDQGALPLPGVRVTIAPTLGAAVVATTDEDGRFATNVPPGRYVLSAELQGFTRVQRPLVVAAAPITIDLTLVVAMEEQVSVSAPAEPIVGDALPMPQATLTRDVIDVAMLPNNTFDDVLPLLPNVIRGPDGMISVAGARAPQGQMLVNGLSQNDPVMGEPDIMLPLEPIGSVQVYTNEYPSEYGRATGGLTVINMRSGDDTFRVNFNSFTPRLQFSPHGISGVEAWEPNLGLSGPLAKGRLWFYQGLDYRFVRNEFDTLQGSQDNKYTAVLSWSSLDWAVSPGHRASISVGVDPQTTNHENITAFTPASTVPSFRRGGVRVSLSDRVVSGERTTIETSAQVASLPTRLTPDGSQPYVEGHDVTQGAYFNTQDRVASRVEAATTMSHEFGAGEARHVVKAGVDVAAVGFGGANDSAPVALLRSDGTLAHTIVFSGSPHDGAHGTEAAVFLQDTWTVDPALTIEAGVRYDRASLAGAGVAAPRAGATIKLDPHTTLSAGGGLFSDKVVLAAAAFPQLQARTVTDFDSAGAMTTAPRLYVNRIDGPLAIPRAAAWHVQLDRRFDAGLITRLTYQERSGSRELVVNPSAASIANESGLPEYALTLSSTGSSRARSLETTIGYRSPGGQSIYGSYVRSTTRGDLNDFSSIDGNTVEPFVQANASGPLAADVPNRLLAWGVVKLPAKFQVAPFMELRDGFPYSAIDDEWRFVGARNSRRYPAFVSFDIYVSTVVKLPRNLPHARIGLKMYNLFGAQDARDIQRDVMRPDFGATYNPIPRDFRSIFELVWGEK